MLKREILNSYFKIFNINVDNISTVMDSNSSEVYILTLKNSKKVVLKIPFSRMKLEREKKALDLLHENDFVPQILEYYNGDTILPGALLISYIDGKPSYNNISKDLAFQMGVKLAKIHCTPLMKYGNIEMKGEKDDPIIYFNNLKDNYQNSVKFCEKVMDHQTMKLCNVIFENYLSKIQIPDGPCLIHNDFRLGNILINDNRVIGIIDYEVANGGAAEADFSLINQELFKVNEDAKIGFLNGYNSIKTLPDLENTLPFYELLTAFSRIGWCVKREKTHEAFYFDFYNQIKKIIEEYKSV